MIHWVVGIPVEKNPPVRGIGYVLTPETGINFGWLHFIGRHTLRCCWNATR